MSSPSDKIRGIDETRTNLPAGTRDRDVRPFGQRLKSGLEKRSNMTALLGVITIFEFLMPGAGLWLALLATGLCIFGMSRMEPAPMKIPVQEKMLDQNELHPANNTPTMGKGIFFLGCDIKNAKEIWVTNDDCRQHFLILGTTGAGKSLPVDAPVLTGDGWKPMGDIRVGDLIRTPSGDLAPVTGVYPQGLQDVGRLTFADGRTAEASHDHLWTVFLNGARRPRQMTTAELHGSMSRGHRVELPLRKGDDGIFELRRHLLTLRDSHPVDTSTKGVVRIGGLEEDVALSLVDDIRAQGGLASHEHGMLCFPEWVLRPDINTRPRRLRLVSVEMSHSIQDCVCLKLDHPDHLFITSNHVVTHNTEILLAFAANALSWGSGFLFVDGKGDISLFAKVWVMCRRWGREDDLLVLNFMTGNKSSTGGGDGTVSSNTLNPFSSGSADGLVQLVVSLMPGSGGGNGDMWKGRATAMFTGLMYALVWLRDNGIMNMGVSEIRDFLQLKNIMALAKEENYPDMPPSIRKAVKAYLSSLAGYKEEAGEKQAGSVNEQHGYLEMQFTQIFGSLADVYSHIFNTQYGEVDMFDLVLNRRVLVVMLPALEKEEGELANLGKIVVASLKGMMGAVLGHELEGTWDDIVENRPTSSPSPYIVIFDEVGYYTVSGMALMAAQARSLGFALVFASQDLNAMKRLNEKEAASIIANTNIKALMRTEDKDTGQLAIEAGGKGQKVTTGGYQRKPGELSTTVWEENENVSYETSERIDFLDLKGQNAGYLHMIYKDKVIRARSFYADAPGAVDVKKVKMRPNHFIVVTKPSLGEMESAARAPGILAKFVDNDYPETMAREADAMMEASLAGESPIAVASRMLEVCRTQRKTPVEGACISIADIIFMNNDSTASYTASVNEARRRGNSVNELLEPNGVPEPQGNPFNDIHFGSDMDVTKNLPFDDTVEHSITVDDEKHDLLTPDEITDAELSAFSALNVDDEGEADSQGSMSADLDAALGGDTSMQGMPPGFDDVMETAHKVDTAAADDDDDKGAEGTEGDDAGETNDIYQEFIETLMKDDSEEKE
ncbi:type IV secretory system conjugative DNA transfer family protein [Gluconobacter potus]|uniref:type IV secretory system conjugative DNA transfer family protein n=1 Tax=Gluconobacter potus TaxID=2724927 RepID=UPI0007845FE8|nr:TraM recognition domain-containing protein [Gluconobacter potus]